MSEFTPGDLSEMAPFQEGYPSPDQIRQAYAEWDRVDLSLRNGLRFPGSSIEISLEGHLKVVFGRPHDPDITIEIARDTSLDPDDVPDMTIVETKWLKGQAYPTGKKKRYTVIKDGSEALYEAFTSRYRINIDPHEPLESEESAVETPLSLMTNQEFSDLKFIDQALHEGYGRHASTIGHRVMGRIFGE